MLGIVCRVPGGTVAESVVIAAIDLHQKQQLSFWDAMVVHSAATLGCERLYSEDLNAGQLILGVRVVNPFSGAIGSASP